MPSSEIGATARIRGSSCVKEEAQRPVSVSDLPPDGNSPRFPATGELFDDCLLLTELGRGAEGRVFLAAQQSLENRPIVLKVTPLRGTEHLSLARVLHTHIAPLLYVRDFHGLGLRVLAMPYVGGASLSRLLFILREWPSPPQSGRDILAELDRVGAEFPAAVGISRSLRERLASIDYPSFVAWLGASMADGLAHAHERGLVHLDIKPGNILLGADGHPLLLDFHLARPALSAGALPPELFGGSRGYMAPEQAQAGEAFKSGKPTPVGVDGRTDIYALGVVLYEMLTGEMPEDGTSAETEVRLRRLYPDLSLGLIDIILRCLKSDPGRRYGQAADLADDLRRHLTHQPLRGVHNRDRAERWRKWRRRHPGALGRLILTSLVFVAVSVGLVMAGRSILDRQRAVAGAIEESRLLAEKGDLTAAAHLLERTPLPYGWPGASALATELSAQREAVRERLNANRLQFQRSQVSADLARLANDLRIGWDVDRLSKARCRQLDQQCARLWARRGDFQSPALTAEEHDDLLELMLVRISLRQRLASSPQASRQDNLALLDEAEAILGQCPAISGERKRLVSGALPEEPVSPQASAWEQYWNGRLLLRAGRIKAAQDQFLAVGEQRPDAFWPCFYRGVCAYRLAWYDEAERAFRICQALMPRSAAVYVNRASALAALDRNDRAKACLDRAVHLEPGLAEAWFQRGLLQAREKNYSAAIADLKRGLEAGADSGPSHFNLAVVYRELGDFLQARQQVEMALAANPADSEALRLKEQLRP